MSLNALTPNQTVFFHEETLPMTVRAISLRYAVCTRKFDTKAAEDIEYAEHRVEMSAYSSIESALEALKDEYVYTIIDFQDQIKGPHNHFFADYDFDKNEDMIRIITDLELGEIEISHRNRATLNIDWSRTPHLPF